eukprot:sb/3467290/
MRLIMAFYLLVAALWRPATSTDWTAVKRGVTIPLDLEGTPIQIKTDSTLGSEQRIWLNVFDKDGVYISSVSVWFKSPIQYQILYCTAWTDLPVQPPADVEKIWTFTITKTALTITCNNVEVLNYLFADSSLSDCVTNLSSDGGVEKIMFSSTSDTASDFYRAGKAPVECPTFTVEGSTQGSWAASPTGTTATIQCAANHILVGNATLTCDDDGSWSSAEPSCDLKTAFVSESIARKRMPYKKSTPKCIRVDLLFIRVWSHRPFEIQSASPQYLVHTMCPLSYLNPIPCLPSYDYSSHIVKGG